jgi:hypothetical protein
VCGFRLSLREHESTFEHEGIESARNKQGRHEREGERSRERWGEGKGVFWGGFYVVVPRVKVVFGRFRKLTTS